MFSLDSLGLLGEAGQDDIIPSEQGVLGGDGTRPVSRASEREQGSS